MRELGEYGMSYGTSQAFEGEQGKHLLNRTDTLLINLRTLIRNAQSAFPNDSMVRTDKGAIKEATVDDIKGIVDALQKINPNSTMEVKLFYPSYKSLKKIFSKADVWEPKTDKQKALVKLHEDVAESIIKDYKGLVVLTDTHLMDFKGRGTIITHHPVDLVLTPAWSRLTLLESYSGASKPYLLWYTKLTGDNLENIPLTKLTIQVFGDQSTNFRSSSLKIKNLVKDLAKRANWTSATTPERVKSSINSYLTGIDRAGLNLLL